MYKQSAALMWCAAAAACANMPAVDDLVTEQAAPGAGKAFFASAGNGVELRVTDIGATSFVPDIAVFDPSGTRVAHASAPDVAGVVFQAQMTGNYTFEVTDASTAGRLGDFGLALVVASSTAQGVALVPGQPVRAHLAKGAIDPYSFTAAAGEGIELRVTDVAAGALMPGLTVYGPTGALVHTTWSPDVAGLIFAAPSAGTYTVVVEDRSGSWAATGDYTLLFITTP